MRLPSSTCHNEYDTPSTYTPTFGSIVSSLEGLVEDIKARFPESRARSLALAKLDEAYLWLHACE